MADAQMVREEFEALTKELQLKVLKEFAFKHRVYVDYYDDRVEVSTNLWFRHTANEFPRRVVWFTPKDLGLAKFITHRWEYMPNWNEYNKELYMLLKDNHGKLTKKEDIERKKELNKLLDREEKALANAMWNEYFSEN